MKSLAIACALWCLGVLPTNIFAADITPRVELEEDIYSYTNAENGAGPMWCAGSTCIVRSGESAFVSGLETVADATPLNNCRWMLFARDAQGWRQVSVDQTGLTREPAPLAAFPDGRILLSVNPSLDPTAYAGPAQPDVLQFDAHAPAAGRFHVTPDNRLFVVHLASGTDEHGSRVFENRIVEMMHDGTVDPTTRIPLQKPFTSFFTTTVRAGSPQSWTLEMLGPRDGTPTTLSYARVNLLQP